MCFRSETEIFVRLCLPFKTRPLLELFSGSSLFFGCPVVFLFAVVASLFSLLFRRWGTTNRNAVCGSPCVLPGHALRHRPVRPAPQFPPGHRPAPVFLVSLSSSRSLSLSISVSVFGRPWCLLA